MAKFLASVGVFSGKLGGYIFSHNKGGRYCRVFAVPTNPNSTRQQEVRGALATQSAAWESLTDAQRSAWTTWAQNNPITDPLGQEFMRTGHQAFSGLRARQQDAALTLTDDPPAEPVPAVLTTFVVAFVDEASVTVTYTAALAADEALYLWMSLPQEGAGDPNFKQSVLVGYSALAAASPIAMELPRAVTTDFTVNFWGGRISEGGQVGVALKSRVVNT